MKLNIQTDPAWKYEVMTEGTDINGISWVDKLGFGGMLNLGWGCVVTSLANIFQIHLGKSFNPRQLNNLLKGHKGYQFLYDKNTLEKEASFIVWEVLEKLFQIKVDRFLDKKDYIKEEDTYYIAHIPGHYVNLLFVDQHNRFWCFDVANGEVCDYTKKIDFLHKVSWL